jgi:hypothetical protein
VKKSVSNRLAAAATKKTRMRCWVNGCAAFVEDRSAMGLLLLLLLLDGDGDDALLGGLEEANRHVDM